MPQLEIPCSIETNDETGDSFLEMAKLGQSTLLIVPENARALPHETPIFSSTMPTVVKLTKREGVPLAVWPSVGSPRLIERRSIEWFGPTLFVSSLFLIGQQHAVSVVLGVVANYITQIVGLGGTSGRSGAMVRMGVYVHNDKKGSTTRISYNGPVAGLPQLEGAIRAAAELATGAPHDRNE